VEKAALELTRHGLNPRMMVDCSHDNTNKDYTRQPAALQNIADQLIAGAQHLMGVMIESHLVAGKQPISKDRSQLVYGQSITDACVDLTTTTTMLRGLAKAVAASRTSLSMAL
jgi:3-deoxy-7-phosphoheptulonate synthase